MIQRRWLWAWYHILSEQIEEEREDGANHQHCRDRYQGLCLLINDQYQHLCEETSRALIRLHRGQSFAQTYNQAATDEQDITMRAQAEVDQVTSLIRGVVGDELRLWASFGRPAGSW